MAVLRYGGPPPRHFVRQSHPYPTGFLWGLLVKIPEPEYYVVNNGMDETPPEREDLKLSEAFKVPSEGYAYLHQ